MLLLLLQMMRRVAVVDRQCVLGSASLPHRLMPTCAVYLRLRVGSVRRVGRGPPVHQWRHRLGASAGQQEKLVRAYPDKARTLLLTRKMRQLSTVRLGAAPLARGGGGTPTIIIVAEPSLSATSLKCASMFADAWLQDCTASSLMSPGCAALPALPGYSVRLVTKVRSVTAAPALCTLRIRSGLRPTDEARCWSLRDSMGGNLESIREAVV